MPGAGPAAHVGADLGHQLQSRVGADGIDLAQVGAAGESMQRGADVKARRVSFGQSSGARAAVGWGAVAGGQPGC